jgi:hypothetical protein
MDKLDSKNTRCGEEAKCFARIFIYTHRSGDEIVLVPDHRLHVPRVRRKQILRVRLCSSWRGDRCPRRVLVLDPVTLLVSLNLLPNEQPTATHVLYGLYALRVALSTGLCAIGSQGRAPRWRSLSSLGGLSIEYEIHACLGELCVRD